ncbi:MAG: sulfotransferase domain-containing protein [Chloroflexi bacterium]|nr:sulfotransferase domain-containing protein [Chloroflexota bacterium]
MSRDFELDFIGVGAPKAGTTWLAQCLDEHPQVCISKPKELNYFCARQLRPTIPVNRHKGERWLRSRFSHWKSGQLKGEISVCYLVDPQSSIFIKERFPNVKVIITYRNPVEILYSLYYQAGKQFAIPDTFEEFIREDPYRIQTGYYYTQTMRYLEQFPRANMHFILFEDIHQDPQKVLGDLFKFLNINANFLPASTYKRVNVRKAPRFVMVRNFIGNSRIFLNSTPALRRIKNLLSVLGVEYLVNKIYEMNLHATFVPPLKEDTRKQLTELYAEENMLLGKLLKRDLSHWNELKIEAKAPFR